MLIVIEGLDGAGKKTQTTLLIQVLTEMGYFIMTKDFPQYEQSFFGKIIGDFLIGRYGDPTRIDPKYSSLLYAGDRLEAKEELDQAEKNGKIIVLNRYVPSNLAYNLAKMPDATLEDKVKFVKYVEEMEYGVNKILLPNLVLYLDIPVQVANGCIDKKEEREYLKESANTKKDMYESNLFFQTQVRDVYVELCNKRKNWERIRCYENERYLTKEEIHTKIMDCVLQNLETYEENIQEK